MGAIDASVRRNTVIHGHNHLRAAGVSLIDHFRAQAVAIFKTVWHQVRDVAVAQRPQGQNAQRGAGGAVGVKIADHHNMQPLLKCAVEHLYRFFDAGQLRPRQHAFHAALQLLRATHAAAGVQPLQQRWEIGR